MLEEDYDYDSMNEDGKRLVPRKTKPRDSDALDRIVDLLHGEKEYTGREEDIAAVVRSTGRECMSRNDSEPCGGGCGATLYDCQCDAEYDSWSDEQLLEEG